MPQQPPPADRVDPPLAADEMAMLASWLDYHRETLVWKASGLSDADARRPMTPSGTSLLGLLKHCGYVEQWWFGMVFRGLDLPTPWTKEDPDAEWRVGEDETVESVVAFYRDRCARAREWVEGASADDVAAMDHPRVAGTTLRWIMIHMIEETARHNGHADIVRELIDGSVGD